MEKFITATGKSIDLAIEAGLTQLGMDRDSVSVEILETPKSGFFGIGASPAKVKLTYEAPDEPAAPAPALSSASRSKPKKPAEQKPSETADVFLTAAARHEHDMQVPFFKMQGFHAGFEESHSADSTVLKSE